MGSGRPEKTIYRKKTREMLMRLIFQMSSDGDFSDAAKDAYITDASLYSGEGPDEPPEGSIFNEGSGESPDFAYFNLAFECVRDNISQIDAALTSASDGWAVKRMGIAELAILRVAAAEILYIDGIDAAVSVNEAVVLAKKYGTEKSASFVNGVLGTIAGKDGGAAS